MNQTKGPGSIPSSPPGRCVSWQFLLRLALACQLVYFMSSGSWALDLAEITLEELVDMEITSVSKHPQLISETAAAVYVITQEDIRRSGATSIPEILRLVPGINVAQINASKWAVSARGFNGRMANKLLVLMDGRSVYSPTFSGVFWEAQDPVLEDVERIEVIRGPGAATWGANAVNGVINIITRNAEDTTGGLVSLAKGSEIKGLGVARYGAPIGDNGAYRVYAKGSGRDTSNGADGEDQADDTQMLRAGFRADLTTSDSDTWMIQGEIFTGQNGEQKAAPSLVPPYSVEEDSQTDLDGGHLLAHWERQLESGSQLSAQAYYDYFSRDMDQFQNEARHTADIDFQYRFFPTDCQDVIWGLGYRLTRDDIDNSFPISFDPDHAVDQIINASIQDDILFADGQFHLIIGSKFEHNDYTGLEILPNLRGLWQPSPGHTFWAAASRAVRMPSRFDHDLRFVKTVQPPAPGSTYPRVVTNFGSSDIDSEKVLAFELGYRQLTGDDTLFDVALFFNDYRDLRIFEPGTPYLETDPEPAHMVSPNIASNDLEGETYGAEIALQHRLLPWWNVKAAYSWLQIQLHRTHDNQSTNAEKAEGESPHNQISLFSSMDLPYRLSLDVWARYVDTLPTLEISSYWTMDARIAWQIRDDLELSIVGQNLLEEEHAEFVPEFSNFTHDAQVERSVYGKLTWTF